MSEFTHLDSDGQARMVDISEKAPSKRRATARARIVMAPDTLAKIMDASLPKGDVLATARIAGIMAAKKTSELIPMCHPLALSSVSITFDTIGDDTINILASATIEGKTGVEMEALTAASIAALTLYDMCKSVDKAMVVEEIILLEKSGGKSSDWRHPSLEETPNDKR